jgi:hypothetical protein
MPKGLLVGLSSLWAVACSSSNVQPKLAPCTAASGGGQVSLAVAGYTAIDPTQSAGCAGFGANATASARQYLLVPQAVSGVPDDSSGFLLEGATAPAAAPRFAAALGATVPLPPQQQFDLTLRRAERELASRAGVVGRPEAAAPLGRGAPLVGDRRVFKVCGNSDCSTHPTVVAFARSVGTHIAVFQDSVDEANGRTLSSVDFDTLRALFDTLLYAADTAAFGRESDIDNNGVVIVLMTGKVNSLVPSPCTQGYIAGYFYGGDLLTTFANGNASEIFYSIVPDPNATLSCMHTATGVKRTVPSTFIHEFQHMISFNQHVLLRGSRSGEDLWLNEGLSHYAEELGARLFLPGDSTTFCLFIFGDLYNSAQYLAAPESHLLVDTVGIGGLANRGAYWLFVRFMVDQFSSDTARAANNVVTRALDGTPFTGAANVTNATGTPFATVAARWALANYVSDLPAFTAPPELQYKRWRFRSDYQTIRNACVARVSPAPPFPSAYPLVAGSGDGSAINLSGTLHSGSGSYYVAQQAAGAAGFTLLFSNSTGFALRASLAPRLNVLRLQ